MLLSIAQNSTAWGPLGHRTVAYLGEKYFTSNASTFVDSLLHGEDISDAATWPDAIRRKPGWTHSAAWHFIDAEDDPPRSCRVNLQRDCLPSTGCAVSAIANMTGRLRNASLDDDQHYQAFKFLIHIIGDIHQPLHTEAEKRGGNDIKVLFNGKPTNLHSTWDNEMVEAHAGRPGDDVDEEKEDARKWAERLYNATQGEGSSSSGECDDIGDPVGCALQWAAEANQYICNYVLKDDVEGKDLAGEYYNGAVPIIDYLVTKAGIRLANWVNAIEKSRSTIPMENVSRFVIQT